jgi:hypothetical protein
VMNTCARCGQRYEAGVNLRMPGLLRHGDELELCADCASLLAELLMRAVLSLSFRDSGQELPRYVM